MKRDEKNTTDATVAWLSSDKNAAMSLSADSSVFLNLVGCYEFIAAAAAAHE